MPTMLMQQFSQHRGTIPALIGKRDIRIPALANPPLINTQLLNITGNKFRIKMV